PLFDHFNARDLKTLFKCAASAWAATLLIFINPVLKNYGTAVFLAPIVTFILPPAGIALTTFMGGLMMIIGMALGWAWGVIVAKAALAARPAADTTRIVEALGRQAAAVSQETNVDSSITYQDLIYSGFVLDGRVTAVYFVLILVFIYLMARMRASNPNSQLVQMFGTVVADIYLTNGPLLPNFLGTAPIQMIKPAATAIGISMVCAIIFFPDTTSHFVMAGIEDVLQPMKRLSNLSLAALQNFPTVPNGKKLKETHEELITAYTTTVSSLPFLKVDVSYGRFNADDIVSLQTRLKTMVLSFVEVLQFQSDRVSRQEYREVMIKKSQFHDDDHKHQVGHHQLMATFDMGKQYAHSARDDLLNSEMNAMNIKARPLLVACTEAIDASIDGVRQVNSRRWFTKPSLAQCLEMADARERTVENLKLHRRDFTAAGTESLLAPYRHLFDDEGNFLAGKEESQVAPVEGLVIGMVFEAVILATVDATIDFLQTFIYLEKQRTKSQIWWPGNIRAAAVDISESNPSTGANPRPDQDPSEKKKKVKVKGFHELSRRKPLRARSGLAKFVLAVNEYLFGFEGTYALRVALATVALGLPGVLKGSAGFYNREKGLWALVMAQTGMMPYMVDFTFGFVTKSGATVLGGVLGMVAWYMGAGSGVGNAYGLSAVMAVVVAVGMYFRLWVRRADIQTVVVCMATIYLVVGYSFLDFHNPSYGSAGVGYTVFWRRTLVVLVGSATAAIIQFLPVPSSSTTHIAKSLSSILETQAELYALFVSHPSPNTLQKHVEETLLSTYETMNELQPMLEILEFEFTSSPFSKSSLMKIAGLTNRINTHLCQFLNAASKLPPTLLKQFQDSMGCKDERVVADIMSVLAIVDLALRTSRPLPAIMPNPLPKRVVMLQRPGAGAMTIELIKLPESREFCTAVVGWTGFLTALDELVLALKERLGEWGAFDAFDEDVEGLVK
ncbi:hypothetical protein BKA61DRAFT_712814, partial [Leptodontidium sp. MPI-SDFR-AT-0119]